MLPIFEHLLPRSPIWRLSVGKQLRQLFEGLAGSISDARENADQIWATVDPQTTAELPTWENQFGLWGKGTDAERRASLQAAWSETGGQSPAYIEAQVRAAGFDVYLHQWWTDDQPLEQTQCGMQSAMCGDVAAECQERTWLTWCKNPLLFAQQPQIGAIQCGEAGPSPIPMAQCGESAALCSDELRNEPGYIVNMQLTTNTPPPIPNDPDKWPYFLYWGGLNFPERATVPKARELEFKRLVLKLCPARDWLVLLVDFVEVP